MYKSIPNNPMIPNEEKKNYYKTMAEKNPPMHQPNPKQQNYQQPPVQRSQQPFVDLQIYQPPKPKPQKYNPSMYMPYYMPNPFNPSQFGTYMRHTYQPQIIKEYNINIEGVNGDHLKTGLIYEDILPSNISLGTFNSVGERTTIYDFIRSIMFQKEMVMTLI